MSNRDNRITFLEKSIEENPGDPFFRYALAMEYETVEIDKGVLLLKDLQIAQPDYLPTYLTLGRWLHEKAESNEALRILEIGKGLAKKKGDTKTFSEISTLIQNIEFEMD